LDERRSDTKEQLVKIRITRRLALAGAGLALIAGGSGAYAASQDSRPEIQQERQALLDDLAKRLGVTSSALTDALKGALSDRVDAAVVAGRLTQAQGDSVKAAIQAGKFPFLGGIGLGFGMRPGPGFGVGRIGV